MLSIDGSLSGGQRHITAHNAVTDIAYITMQSVLSTENTGITIQLVDHEIYLLKSLGKAFIVVKTTLPEEER